MLITEPQAVAKRRPTNRRKFRGSEIISLAKGIASNVRTSVFHQKLGTDLELG